MGAPVAYVQQIFVKSSVSPWHKNLLAVDVFRSPLSRAFQLVEEIRNHVLRDRYRSEGPEPQNPVLYGRKVQSCVLCRNRMRRLVGGPALHPSAACRPTAAAFPPGLGRWRRQSPELCPQVSDTGVHWADPVMS